MTGKPSDMDATTKKAARIREPLSIKPDANYTALKATCKRAVCILALWGLLTPKTAMAILRALGVTHA